MSEYKNITLADVYRELREVRKHVQHLESVIIPEEKLSEKELKELDRLRVEAMREHHGRKTIRIEDL